MIRVWRLGLQRGPGRPRKSAVVLRSGLAALLAATGLVGLGAGSAHADEIYSRPDNGVWTVSGHGYGHGRGMSAWGAYGAAYLGKGHQEILSTYYPGTAMSTVANQNIRVRLTADEGALRVSAAAGLTAVETRTSSGAIAKSHSSCDSWHPLAC